MATEFTYDETKTARENFDIFLNGQKEADYTVGAYTGTEEGDMKLYTDLKVKVAQEQKKKEDFYAARQEAFDALAVQHDAERQTLADEWQAAEDNDYTAI